MNTRKTKYRKSFMILLVIQMLMLFSITAFADGSSVEWVTDALGNDIKLTYYFDGGLCYMSNNYGDSVVEVDYLTAKYEIIKLHEENYVIKHANEELANKIENGRGEIADKDAVFDILGKAKRYVNGKYELVFAFVLLISIIMIKFSAIGVQLANSEVKKKADKQDLLKWQIISLFINGSLYVYVKAFANYLASKAIEMNQSANDIELASKSVWDALKSFAVVTDGIFFLVTLTITIFLLMKLQAKSSNPRGREEALGQLLSSFQLTALFGGGMFVLVGIFGWAL